jgi:hypothetical protein
MYPRNARKWYASGNLIVGAIAGYDTLVSEGFEFTPDIAPFSNFEKGTVDESQEYYATWARSELDLGCEYMDTITDPSIVPPNNWDRRLHIPIGVKVMQRSMAWSANIVDDFVLITYRILNMRNRHLKSVYLGIRRYNGASYITQYDPVVPDNYTGYLFDWPSDLGCGYTDTLRVVYDIDNDGDPVSGRFTEQSPLAAMGLQFLGSSSDSIHVNYNWAYGWGPRRRGTSDDPFRPIGTMLGYPEGDANTYYVLSHPEVDYDQMFCAVDHTTAGWLPPSTSSPPAEDLARGAWPYAWLSFGPFDLLPGGSMEFAVAVVGGDNVHHDPTAFERLFDPLNPQPFYDQLDFSELTENARWAQRVYDNPGVDTDSDGYSGEYRVCEGDTVWYKGDGVPDFRAGSPPPAPYVRIITETGKLVVRWNGFYSETYFDEFIGARDFEGYRVYCGLDDRRSSLSIQSGYDREDYYLYRYVLKSQEAKVSARWVADDSPYTLDSLRALLSDPNLEPTRYPRSRPYPFGDEFLYFSAAGFNQSSLTTPGGIHKVYPDAQDPGEDASLWTEDDITTDYGAPLPKFYEYEYVIDGLLPSVPYFVAVTAFDFGLGGGKIPDMESNPLNDLQRALAQTSADTVEAYNLDVYVYPNPYRVDAGYTEDGYENRKANVIADRARRIHFANLPNVCIISIYTPDGDLVRKLRHNYPEGGPEAMHETWDLINRNVQAVESGLYYWVVESDQRTQIGKLVIIK